jgi:adenine-specific DNA glycosylase
MVEEARPATETAEQPTKADMPRTPVSAYGTWVSEVMLQQTR